MAVNHGAGEEPEDELLPCGQSLMELWENPAGPWVRPAGHPGECPHCAAALAELHALEEFVTRSRVSEAAAPRRELSVSTVMDIVRMELRPGRTLPLGEPDEDAWIVEAAAAKVFRAAVDALPEVTAGSCRIAPVGAGGRNTAERGPVRVRIEVVAGMTWTVPRLAEAVRDAVARAAGERLGLEVLAVDVVVMDLVEPAGGNGRAAW
ncbi:hypothetical protein [Streptomyces carpaticus]|uniref:Asp23/Gls24 family envelope stress response protein n=1 Tax=Streptomyces carpaticus TaxID=285558 RepID=A0ABV4ZPB5_9ACTN